jgi:S-(hydroxymethyl)glutathione dehydrogenase/alcohol dehydrogenase
MKTEAALLVATGQPLQLATLTIPDLKPGQVLVEIAFSGACGTQVLEQRGDKGEDKWVPHCLGHEASGVVLQVGAAVSRVRPGDKVVLSWLKGAGEEAGGSVYDWDGATVNAGAVTTFQRHALVSENRLTPLPRGMSMQLAVLLGCAAPTGMGAVSNILQVTAKDRVAVLGAGGVGLHACMAAAFAGAKVVIAVDPNPARRELAARLGATHLIDPGEGDVVAAIRTLCPGGVDKAVEATGLPEVMAQALDCCHPQGGRAVIIGNARYDAMLTLHPSVFNQGKSLLGAWGGDSDPGRDYGRYGALLMDGRFDAASLLSEPYPLSRTQEALDDLAAGRIGRPLIDMGAV